MYTHLYNFHWDLLSYHRLIFQLLSMRKFEDGWINVWIIIIIIMSAKIQKSSIAGLGLTQVSPQRPIPCFSYPVHLRLHFARSSVRMDVWIIIMTTKRRPLLVMGLLQVTTATGSVLLICSTPATRYYYQIVGLPSRDGWRFVLLLIYAKTVEQIQIKIWQTCSV